MKTTAERALDSINKTTGRRVLATIIFLAPFAALTWFGTMPMAEDLTSGF